jgi:hypothetical protein
MTTASLASRVRLFVFRYVLEHAQAPVVEELMREFALTREATASVLRELETARHLALVKGTARILMAFPFSAIATPFRVTVGGCEYFANCAWDAIAFHAMLGEPIRVDSFCHHCATPIHVELTDGRATLVDPPETLVYLALRPTQWWDDIITTCSNTMVFFASDEHRDASDLCAAPEDAASLTPNQVHRLSGPIYARKLELDYARPSREELIAHFASIGLTGDYWKL